MGAQSGRLKKARQQSWSKSCALLPLKIKENILNCKFNILKNNNIQFAVEWYLLDYIYKLIYIYMQITKYITFLNWFGKINFI